MDKTEGRYIKAFLGSLRHLPLRDDSLFHVGSRVSSFLVRCGLRKVAQGSHEGLDRLGYPIWPHNKRLFDPIFVLHHK